MKVASAEKLAEWFLQKSIQHADGTGEWEWIGDDMCSVLSLAIGMLTTEQRRRLIEEVRAEELAPEFDKD